MKRLIQILVTGSFLFYGSSIKAQFNDKKYDKECFLIGMLNEYMGYQRTFTNRDDFYYQRINIMGRKDLKEALFIDSLFNMDYPDITIVNNGAPLGIKLYSPVLSQKIDNYYNYEPGPTYTGQGDTIYYGRLKKGRFVTEKQKQSFLIGAYLSYGKNKDGINSIIQLLKKENLLDKNKAYENVFYGFSIPNAPSKAKLCESFLKDLGCKEVMYVYRRSIPAGNFVIFKPSRKTLKLIVEAERLEQYIESINTNYVKFTPDGNKFIWKESHKPAPPMQKFDLKEFEGIMAKPISEM